MHPLFALAIWTILVAISLAMSAAVRLPGRNSIDGAVTPVLTAATMLHMEHDREAGFLAGPVAIATACVLGVYLLSLILQRRAAYSGRSSRSALRLRGLAVLGTLPGFLALAA